LRFWIFQLLWLWLVPYKHVSNMLCVYKQHDTRRLPMVMKILL
jgi:hypothetical protein